MVDIAVDVPVDETTFTIAIPEDAETERPRASGIRNSVAKELDRHPPFAYRKTTLTAGAFAGRTARTWMGDGAVLYVQNASYAVEIAGDLTRSELLAIAGSLQQ